MVPRGNTAAILGAIEPKKKRKVILWPPPQNATFFPVDRKSRTSARVVPEKQAWELSQCVLSEGLDFYRLFMGVFDVVIVVL